MDPYIEDGGKIYLNPAAFSIPKTLDESWPRIAVAEPVVKFTCTSSGTPHYRLRAEVVANVVLVCNYTVGS